MPSKGRTPYYPMRNVYHGCRQKVNILHSLRMRLFIPLLVLVLDKTDALYTSGCGIYRRKGLFRHEDIAPCKGFWYGHVSNGKALCSPGWTLCSWRDAERLGKLTWDDVMSFHGCYAYNAQQSHGRCESCSPNSVTGSLAGVGRSCRHRRRGGRSCIGGGVIDVASVRRLPDPCSYDPELISGVLCCRQPIKKPRITLSPPLNMRRYSGEVIAIPCRASGSPLPSIHWYKNGHLLRGNGPRTILRKSGDLLLELTRPSDSGEYVCEAVNEHGNVRVSSTLRVYRKPSGCRDMTTDGLGNHRHVHACSGVWRGHVKHGRRLCTRGWDVCNPRDQATLSEIGWNEVGDLPGCYAYNAANTWGRCTRCHSYKMAGVGKDCGLLRLHRTSCLPQGRVDVYPPKSSTSCLYKKGLTTGILCCRKRKRRRKTVCDPACKNGATCIKPNHCRCIGKICRSRTKQRCAKRCRNGEKCYRRKCKCQPGHRGFRCRILRQRTSSANLKEPNR